MRAGLAGGMRWLALAAVLVSGKFCAGAQTAPTTQAAPVSNAAKPVAPVSVQPVKTTAAGSAPTDAGDTVDRVIAVVNGELVLESDVDEERRFSAFQPFTTPSATFTRDMMVQRLVNRTLILQQAKLQPGGAIKDEDVTKQIDALRKNVPACQHYGCETEAGWNKFLADQGFTADELQERWKQRMEVLSYIENRFRMGIRISPDEIKAYYDKNLPEYAKQKATAPKLAEVSDRIQEVLLQQQVSKLLQDWLTSLRAQGTVQIMKPGEVAP